MATEKFSNSGSTSLAAAITTVGQTAITVGSSSSFPTGGNFHVLINGVEVVRVTAVAGANWTIVRGQDGTAAVTHAISVPINLVITPTSLSNRNRDAVDAGTYASRHAQETAGRLWLPSDAFAPTIDTGSIWAPHGPLWTFTPFVLGDFSWTNQGTASAVSAKGVTTITSQFLAATRQLHSLYKTAPATPYKVEMAFLYSLAPDTGGNPYIGPIFRESSSGSIIHCAYRITNGSLWQYNSQRWTNDTTISTNDLTTNTMPHGIAWVRLGDDGTNRTWEVSQDGINWSTIFSQARTTFITANQIGFGVRGQVVQAGHCRATLLHWKEY